MIGDLPERCWFRAMVLCLCQPTLTLWQESFTHLKPANFSKQAFLGRETMLQYVCVQGMYCCWNQFINFGRAQTNIFLPGSKPSTFVSSYALYSSSPFDSLCFLSFSLPSRPFLHFFLLIPPSFCFYLLCSLLPSQEIGHFSYIPGRATTMPLHFLEPCIFNDLPGLFLNTVCRQQHMPQAVMTNIRIFYWYLLSKLILFPHTLDGNNEWRLVFT